MFVMPWNFSYTALENFLVSSQYCKDDIGSLDKQAQLLTAFTDFVLAENASKWRNSEPFLSTGELKSAWQSFFGARPQAALAKKAQPQDKRQANPRNKQQGSKANGRLSLPSIPVCYKWNAGQCQKPDGQCFTHYGLALRHVCDERTNPANIRESGTEPRMTEPRMTEPRKTEPRMTEHRMTEHRKGPNIERPNLEWDRTSKD
jgi:hypothetical protein